MPSNFRNILILSLLLLLATMTAAAEDAIRPWGCRRGKISLSQIVNRQAPNKTRLTRSSAVNPYIDNRRQLVILAAFSDKSFEDDSLATLQKWNKILNQEGYNDYPYVGSVHDYFYDQSYGQFQLTFDLYYVTVGEASRYASTDLDDENSQFLVNDIVDSLLQRSISWDDYDWLDDGTVNQLLIIYAGKGMNDGGGSNTIWPHQWWLSRHCKQDNPKEFCEPRTFSYGEKDYIVDCYCAVQSEGGTYNPFGTICHEYSHCFGLPDFYYGSVKYLYGWDVMDYGNYNGGGYCPASYSAHERWIMGWLNLTELTKTSTITNMAALSDKGEAYLVRNDGYADEYYVIENRQQTKWDAGLPGNGILISHIDYIPELWRGELSDDEGYMMMVNDYYGDKHCLIFKANNNYETSCWAYPYQDNNQLTNTSTPIAETWHPNTDSQCYMNKSIVDMAVTDGLASFNFKPTPTAVQTVRQEAAQSDGVWYNLSGQRIASPASSVSHPRKGIFICNGKKYVR